MTGIEAVIVHEAALVVTPLVVIGLAGGAVRSVNKRRLAERERRYRSVYTDAELKHARAEVDPYADLQKRHEELKRQMQQQLQREQAKAREAEKRAAANRRAASRGADSLGRWERRYDRAARGQSYTMVFGGRSSGAPSADELRYEEVAVALHAEVPGASPICREVLLNRAAKRLGLQLTKATRSRLNRTISAEVRAGRLRTDWIDVWRRS